VQLCVDIFNDLCSGDVDKYKLNYVQSYISIKDKESNNVFSFRPRKKFIVFCLPTKPNNSTLENACNKNKIEFKYTSREEYEIYINDLKEYHSIANEIKKFM
jgi:hypothetical protein